MSRPIDALIAAALWARVAGRAPDRGRRAQVLRAAARRTAGAEAGGPWAFEAGVWITGASLAYLFRAPVGL